MLRDQVVLVDEQDHEVGVMDKVEAHRNPAKLHRAISVFLFRKNQGELELLLQQRSQHKIVGAGEWANTVCGNVWPGETYEECARRRLKHELNIANVTLTPLYKFTYQIVCNDMCGEHEMDQVFVGRYENAEIIPNIKEVTQIMWIPFFDLEDAVKEKGLHLTPWTQLMLKDSRIYQAEKNNCEILI